MDTLWETLSFMENNDPWVGLITIGQHSYGLDTLLPRMYQQNPAKHVIRLPASYKGFTTFRILLVAQTLYNPALLIFGRSEQLYCHYVPNLLSVINE